MKKLPLLFLAASLAIPAFAQGKPEPKISPACKTGCKMPDEKCPDKCMKACEDRAKAGQPKAPEPKRPA